MSSVITHSTGEITPAVVNGFAATRPAPSVVHTILGRPDPDITYRPAGLRAGTLKLVFETGAEAAAAESVLGAPQVFVLSDPDVPEVYMPFVVADGDGSGEIRSTLDDETQTVWTLEVPFQEVTS